jgi:two-component system, cell cycle sensor histidine kinase and response regulator CckA
MTIASVNRAPGASLLEHLPLVTYTLALGAPFRALFVSPQLETLFGYSPAECEDDPGFWLERIHPEDITRFTAARELLHETHEPMQVEYRVRTKDGHDVWVRDVSVVAPGDDGSLVAHGYLTDVTREKELERELAAARVQADAFFRDSSVGLAITDADGRYVRVNNALARLNGTSPEAHIGRTIGEISPQIAERIQFLHDEVVETGVAVHQREVTAETSVGERHVLLTIFPLLLGGTRHFGRMVVDITGQRRAERGRAAAEEQYRRLIEQLPLVTYVNEVDPARRAIFVSPQIEDLYGYSVDEFLGDPGLGDRVIHPDDLERVERMERAAAERGDRVELEYRIVRSDGEIRWVLDLMETVRDEDGTPRFEQGFLIDITQRRESESLFRAVFDGAFEAVVIFDDEGRFVDVNDAACELFALPREAMLERRVGRDDLERLLERGEASGPHVIVRPSGEEREIEYAARAAVLPGRHLSVIRDVTQRKALERELWRAQRLESVGRLAGGVAHDFNNMLTAIRGHAQLLAHRTRPGSIERSHAEEIDRAADRAAALTAQLLAFGRRQTLRTRPVDLNRLVEGLEDILGRLAGALALEVELDALPAGVRVDPSQIEQALLNLVANAVDVTEAGGRVVVRTRNVELPDGAELDLPSGRYAVLEVEDTGSGIPPAVLEHLFEPFFTTKGQERGGTGLGLATAYGIAKQSGGTIDVATVPTKGTTFSIYLPQVPTPGATVLVVEPERSVRDVLFELLTDAGHRVLTADDREAALALAGKLGGDVDLVFGDDAAAVAVELGPSCRFLVLKKPYTPELLRSEVARHLKG